MTYRNVCNLPSMSAAFWLGIGKLQSVNTEIQFLEAVATHIADLS